jgi:hypothetical protein
VSAQVTPANIQVPSDAVAPILADFPAQALRVAYARRRDLAAVPSADWSCPGVYVLLTDDGSGQAYVGKAVDLRTRLHQHRSKEKLGWARAVLIKRDTTYGFNSAEIGYLEGRLAAEIGAVPGVTVVEGLKSQDNTLPPHDMLALDVLLPGIWAALRIAGVDLAKDADDPTDEPESEHEPRRPMKRFSGTVPELVAAGLLRAGTELFLSQGGRDRTATVSTSGEIIVDGVAYASPSRAAATALGLQSSNGWTTWHVGDLTGPALAQLRARLLEVDDD